MRVVVFSGYNQRAVIAFLRTLTKNSIQYSIIASDDKDSIFYTVYNNGNIYTRTHKELNLDEIKAILVKISDGKEQLFIAPSTEFLNRFLLKHRKVFEEVGCIIPLCDKELYEQISDKNSFAQMCVDAGILVPRTFRNIDRYEFQMVAKPKHYEDSNGKIYNPIFICSKSAYDNFIDTHIASDFDFQEYLDGGESIYLLFYFCKDGTLFSYSQQNIAQQPNGKSMIAAVGTKHYAEGNIVHPYVSLFQSAGYRGLVMVEIRRFDGKDYMIEANPRFWGPSQLFCDAGCNFFEALLWDYGVLENRPEFEYADKTFYLWEEGFGAQRDGKITCDWHYPGEKFYYKNRELFELADIYGRSDTMTINKINLLNKLYMEESKHSNYQILSPKLLPFFDISKISTKSRQEKERMDYIRSHVEFDNKLVLDIGGNTGYFTFEAIEAGAKEVDYYEGNINHAEFVEIASDLVDCSSKIKVYSEYFGFDDDMKDYDIVFNLNVLHHLGDDFDNENSMDQAKCKMVAYLKKLAKHTKIMVFQLGFNWKGNRYKCLFKNGTKAEMIQFIKENCSNEWDFCNIGIAVNDNDDHIVYKELDDSNIERIDSLGEFLNRPIFIMKSREFNE